MTSAQRTLGLPGLVGITDNAIRLAIVGFLVASWQVLVDVHLLDRSLASSPSEIRTVLVEWFRSGSIYPHVLSTLEAVLIGWVVGTALGVAVGFLFAYVPLVAALFQPLMGTINAIPRAALAPLFIVWFGLGMGSKVALAVVLIFFQTFVNTYRGLLEVDGDIVANTRVMGASGLDLCRHVYVPAAVVWVLASIQTNLGFAFIGVIIGEYLGSNHGIGYLLAQGEAVLSLAQMFAALVVMLLVVAAINLFVARLAHRVTDWKAF